eukprot:FR735257.1.p1 GENE.FR735257.1~~FR735257.1.p1  ORF type:complete len:240 (-),score=27.22 FR735257.1:106-825(-)
MLCGIWERIPISPRETARTMITPSAQLPLTKGNKSWSSPAVAPALELVDPSGPWLSLKGENYAQELVDKAPQMPNDVQWHFIGHLQSNKAKSLVASVPGLTVVETVDTLKLAKKLDKAVQDAWPDDRTLGVYLQIDTSGEDTKSGVKPSDAAALATSIVAECPRIVVQGLMTIGAPGDFSCFDRLGACRLEVAAAMDVDAAALVLSMGMSGDYEEAIKRGSSSVRVGSTIFGARAYPPR